MYASCWQAWSIMDSISVSDCWGGTWYCEVIGDMLEKKWLKSIQTVVRWRKMRLLSFISWTFHFSLHVQGVFLHSSICNPSWLLFCKTYMCVYVCVLCAESLQSCPTLCGPMGCSSPGFSVHGTSQARIPKWDPIPSPRGSSWPRNQTLSISCITGRFFTGEPRGKPVCVYVYVYVCVYIYIKCVYICIYICICYYCFVTKLYPSVLRSHALYVNCQAPLSMGLYMYMHIIYMLVIMPPL